MVARFSGLIIVGGFSQMSERAIDGKHAEARWWDEPTATQR